MDRLFRGSTGFIIGFVLGMGVCVGLDYIDGLPIDDSLMRQGNLLTAIIIGIFGGIFAAR